jgi:hypothetical protein
MSATPKTAKIRTPHAAPAPVTPAAPPPAAARAEEPSRIYRPDVCCLWFWFACAGVLVLLHVLDWVGAAFSALFGR